MIYLYHQRGARPQEVCDMWCVVDPFGFAWSDLLETLEEAQAFLAQLREEHWKVQGINIEFEIERRD